VKNYKDLLSKKPLVDQYLSLQEHQLSAYHFSYIFAWSDFFDFSFDVIDDHLCTFAKSSSGTFLYLPPLGKDPLNENLLSECFKRMGPESLKRKVSRVECIEPSALSGWLREGHPQPARTLDFPCFGGQDGDTRRQAPLTLALEPRNSEYIYNKNDIIELSGNAYKSKRHDINHFNKTYQASYVPYTHDHLEGCMALYESWALRRAEEHPDTIYGAMLEDNKHVHRLIFQYADDLGLVGRVVLIEKKVCAYSFGYSLNSQTFCVLLEVADLEKTGLPAYIFNQFCADKVWGGHTKVNAMDDFGMPNVARTKAAYHPVELLPSYTLYPNH
jgi:hypothetical protein